MTHQQSAARVKEADRQHSGFLWLWRNDPETRRHSFSDKAISWREHEQWYAAALSDPSTRIYVLEDPDEGPVAQVRYTRCGDGALEVHVTVAPAARGRGAGVRVLRETAARACRDLGARQVTALVLSDNPRSLAAFERAGYSPEGEQEISGRRCHRLRLDVTDQLSA